ncbi:MAG: PA14 domain-containing protein [Caldilineaceae bacterium]
MKRIFGYAVVGLFLLSLMVVSPAAAQSGNQWVLSFYPNLDWSGAPIYVQYTNLINLNWGAGSPGPGVPAQNYSARMTTEAFFYGGMYRFTLLADDEVSLVINNQTYFSSIGAGQPGKTFVVDVPMNQGTSHVEINFRQYTGPGYISIFWDYVKPSDGGVYAPPQPAPPSAPAAPASAPAISNKYGDFTPCIQQGQHQANCFHATGEWDSPNLGSIQMEPQIVIWQQCKADEEKVQQLFTNQDPRKSKCSKSEAGWFPS